MMRVRSGALNAVFGALCLAVCCSVAGALEVRDKRWGFDGKVQPYRFGVLSVLVSNDTPAPFDGALTLENMQYGGARAGAQYVQPCYLSPYSSRWVQFHPYITSRPGSWMLSWGREEDERLALAEPALGAPATVLVVSPSEVVGLPGRLRRFPEGALPASAAVMGGLHAVALDHVPRWSPVQQEAFLDWLYAGGSVLLLRDNQQAYPVFTGDLAVLNIASDSLRIRSGRVMKLNATRQEVDQAFLVRQRFWMPSLVQSDEGYIYEPTDQMFQGLRGLIDRDHNWVLIYLLTLLYVLLIGPGNYLIARKQRFCRRATIFFCATVAGAALLFTVTGIQGFGDDAEAFSVAYARHVRGDQYLVTEWANLYVTNGGDYEVSYEAPYNAISAYESDRAVNGIIQSGPEGRMVVRIPLYASQAYAHAARMTGVDFKASVSKWPAKDVPFALSCDPGAAKLVTEAWARYKGDYMRLSLEGGKFVSSKPIDEKRFFGYEGFHMPFGPMGRAAGMGGGDRNDELNGMVRPAIALGIGGNKAFNQLITSPLMDGGRVDVFLVTPTPEGFYVKANADTGNYGRAIYHFTFYGTGNTGM